MQTNQVKATLRAGGAVHGCFVRTPDPGLVEFLGYLGWDFVVFDGEHGTIDPYRAEDMVRAAELRGVTPLVRATTNHAPTVLRFMDTGALGVHIPWINSGAEAEAAVQAVKYNPRGLRGLAGVRASGFAQLMPLSDYVHHANEQTLVVLHIETAEAVERIGDIVAVDGVDVAFVGPTDLSQSLGVPGQTTHPSVLAAIDRVLDAAAASPVAVGILARDPESAVRWRARGIRYIATTLESVLGPACRQFLAAARAG